MYIIRWKICVFPSFSTYLGWIFGRNITICQAYCNCIVLIDLGQGQGHSDKGQTANIGGNNIWTFLLVASLNKYSPLLNVFKFYIGDYQQTCEHSCESSEISINIMLHYRNNAIERISCLGGNKQCIYDIIVTNKEN